MSRIRSSNTKPELLLRKALWRAGFRYGLKSKLKGKPDIVLTKYRILIFVDGEFWHGFKWEEKKPKIVANREYWIKKIEKNIARDRENRSFLRSEGWNVVASK